MTTGPLQANRQIARAAGTVMAAFVLSNLIGLIRQILVSNAFGTGDEIDAFYAASRLPDLIFVLVAGGALASAFVPTFTGLLATDRRPAAWRLASQIANLILLLLVVGSLAAAFLAEPIVKTLLTPDFPVWKQELTAAIMQILLLTPAIFGLSGLLMGILNAHQVFFLPALAPTMYWLGMIFGVLVLAPRFGIYGLAWGAVLGALLHFLIQLPALWRIPERRYTRGLGLDSPDVREVARLMVPRLLGVAIVQLNFWINIYIAQGLGTGPITALTVAWQVMTMPQVVIAQAIAIAALPTFSAQAAAGRLVDLRQSLAGTLRGVLLLSLPAALGLILLREPLISLLFERGQFTSTSTELVAWALLWYTAGLVSHSIVEIVSRSFYALHDTKTPVIVGIAAMSLNVVLSFTLTALFTRSGWYPHGGLALANTIATSLEMVGLLVLMNRRLQGLDLRRVIFGLLQASAATAVMSIGLFLWLDWTADFSIWLVCLGGILLGGLLYGLILLVLRVPELLNLINFARRRLFPHVTPGTEP